MRSKDAHLSDEDLLLAADGELPAQRIKQVTEHLAACWDCRTRRGRLEATIADVVEARHAVLDPQLPSGVGRRALLKAHLSEQAGARPSRWSRSIHRLRARRILAFGLAAAVFVLCAAAVMYRARVRDSSSILAQIPLEPSRRLTPGATRQVNLHEVCTAGTEDRTARVIPASLQREVFQEYGMNGASSKDYEVDFLITPELGGSNDIHNLWPEPYYSTVWNAHVKDELEDRLHEMVCNGQVDLSTAQRDISSDWILAYKKYFHTDKPL